MELLTPDIENALDQAGVDGNAAICRFFTPDGPFAWVIFGRDPEDPDVLYGLAQRVLSTVGSPGGTLSGMGLTRWLSEPEYGTVSLSELSELRGPCGLPLERDLFWADVGQPLEFFLERGTL